MKTKINKRAIFRGFLLFIMGGLIMWLLSPIFFPTYHEPIQGGYFYSILKDSVPSGSSINLFGKDFLIVQGIGSSMMPSIPNGSFILIDENPDNIIPGDIILYKFNSTFSYATHRVIKIENNTYFTRGDNVNFDISDHWVNKEDIIGKVVGVLY